jgi:hypothetical protein
VRVAVEQCGRVRVPGDRIASARHQQGGRRQPGESPTDETPNCSFKTATPSP